MPVIFEKARRALLLIVLLSVSPADAAKAADAEGDFAIKGVGRLLCTQFIEARAGETEIYTRLLGWLEGYLTAANRYEAETHDMVPWESSALLSLVIDNHCQENPDQFFFEVVQRIVEDLKTVRIVTPSPRIEAKVGNDTVVVYQEVLRRAQAELAKRGIYRSSVDGLFGQDTREAIETFQVLEGLDVSGLPDQVTLSRLFADRHPLIR